MEGWLVGVLLTIVSAAGSTCGLILQKIAHLREQEAKRLGKETKTFSCFDIPCNKYFIGGFIMLALVPLPFDFIALANAGQSILPVGTGCTVIFGQLLAPKMLGKTDKVGYCCNIGNHKLYNTIHSNRHSRVTDIHSVASFVFVHANAFHSHDNHNFYRHFCMYSYCAQPKTTK